MANSLKLVVGLFFAFFVIIFSIMTSLSILKDEAVDNYLTISKLNAKSFSKELNQDLSNMEQTILNLENFFKTTKDYSNIENRLFEIIQDYPQVRSINILKNNRIIYSSNSYNSGLYLPNQNFYPKPIFDDNILKISTPWIGRDFVSGSDVYVNEEEIKANEQSFIPISKNIVIDNKVHQVIINLNTDYFKDRFFSNITSGEIIFEILRLDGILLLSTNENHKIGKRIKKSDLLKAAIEKNQYTGIEVIDNHKYIVTYILTNNYPIILLVKLDYEKSLSSWNKRQYNFFVVTTIIVVLSILIALFFFYLYTRKKEEEIKQERAQVQEQEKFKLLFQDSHFLATVIDSNGRILEMNNVALDFLGENVKSIHKKKFWDLKCWIGSDKSTIKNKIKNFTKKKYEDEVIVLNKDKEERIVEFTLSSINNAEETLLVAIGLDITLKKEKENKLKQAYTVFSNTRDGIMITNSDTVILDVNIAFEKITGYKKEDILNKKVNALKSNTHTNEFYSKMWESILAKGFWEGEITNKKSDGTNFIEWLTINAIKNENNEVVNYIGVFSDITEQKLREKLLKEKDYALFQQSKMAAMGEMIGNIAHQWRQPLSVISTAATGIILHKEMGISVEEDEIKTLNAINDSAQFLSQTIEDFRSFLKLDKEVQLFNINKTIHDALDLSSINRKNKSISIVCEIEENLEVYGVKNEFIQVMMNILKNAEDALDKQEAEKLILINSYLDGQNVIIKIMDNAGGIDSKIISRIFEPYFTTKHQSQGTGIGLYMSQEIIRNHMNGKLYVENYSYTYKDSSYVGACFIIELPFK
ncbi:PAS domain S-box protein [Halarcobacter sp.]|uniref:sensor histidine kinase n=1 Tax=Halarcobacter sp. TaxID=2321133 RepID=UPI003A93A863